MSKYRANISIGWLNEWYEADTPAGIIKKTEKDQDFDCLLRMGRSMEDDEGQKELDKLELFLDKYHDKTLTIEDIRNLDIHLEAGSIKCLEAIENSTGSSNSSRKGRRK